MPQLDKTIIFSQLFWLFIILFSFYFLLTYIYLPKFLYALKSRKYILEKTDEENVRLIKLLNYKQKFTKDKLNTFILSLKYNYSKLEIIIKKDYTNLNKIDTKLISLITKTYLYCNNILLKNILFYPKFFNFYKKN